ncbi:MAG: hypothetical protein PHD41_02625, partial [Methanosarcinaceae archaeon]|nr:hypothetical protein [Methanosarcinaceae archaeon]
ISEKHDIGKLAELVPEVVGKLKDFHGKKKKRVTDEEAKESKEDKERRKEGETEAGAKESETGQFRS